MYMKPVGTDSSIVARYRSTERSTASASKRSCSTSVAPYRTEQFITALP